MSEEENFEVRTIEQVVVTEGKPLFDISATRVRIVDEAAGEFVEVIQEIENQQVIKIDPAEWTFLKEVIETMVKTCR